LKTAPNINKHSTD